MSFERTTPCGMISGTACQWPGIAAYKGIRYATAGRWEFPVPITHWTVSTMPPGTVPAATAPRLL